MKYRKNIAGHRFGKLTAIEPRPGNSWLCQCDCGNTKVVRYASLQSGNTKSCGCLRNKNPGRPKSALPHKKYIPVNYFHDHTAQVWPQIEEELNKHGVTFGKSDGNFYFYANGKKFWPYTTKLHAIADALSITLTE